MSFECVVFSFEMNTNNVVSSIHFPHSTKDNLYASWYVAAPYKDIADIYVNVRDASNKLLLERHLPYDSRRVQLSGAELAADGPLQLCVQAKNSDGSIGSWFDVQCYALPTDLAAVRRKYSAYFNGVYTMLSSKPPRGSAKGRRGSRSGGARRCDGIEIGHTVGWIVSVWTTVAMWRFLV